MYLWDGILPISLSVLPSEIVGDFDFMASIIAAAIPEALEAGLDSSLEGGFDGSLGEGVLDLRTSDLTIVGSSSSINTPKLISRKNRVAEFFFSKCQKYSFVSHKFMIVAIKWHFMTLIVQNAY